MIILYKSKNGKTKIIDSWETNYRAEINNQPESVYKKIITAFLNSNFKFDKSSKKKIMQSLRHFDEVGISNELYDTLCDLEDYEYFGTADDKINGYAGIYIISEEI